MLFAVTTKVRLDGLFNFPTYFSWITDPCLASSNPLCERVYVRDVGVIYDGLDLNCGSLLAASLREPMPCIRLMSLLNIFYISLCGLVFSSDQAATFCKISISELSRLEF